MNRTVAQKSTEDVKLLWNQYHTTRSESAREKLVIQHIPLVKYVIGRMFSHLPANVSREDLLNTGVLGLITAIECFDPSMNIKFGTYAVPRIKGAILDEFFILQIYCF